jgi:hypothetical protein
LYLLLPSRLFVPWRAREGEVWRILKERGEYGEKIFLNDFGMRLMMLRSEEEATTWLFLSWG